MNGRALRLAEGVQFLARVFLFAGSSAAAVLFGGAAVLAWAPSLGDGSAASLAILGAITAAGLMVGLAAVRFVDHDALALAGLGRDGWRPITLVAGFVFGSAVILLPAGLLLLTGQLVIEEQPAGDWWGGAGRIVLLLAAPALAEELLARGYLLGLTSRLLGDGIGVLFTSVVFGVLHAANPGASAQSIAAVGLAGVFLAVLRLRTGSLMAVWLAHLAVNVMQAAVLHLPVSGLRLFETSSYRLVAVGPSWLTGGEWGLEAGVATAVALVGVTFLLLQLPRSTELSTLTVPTRPSAALEDVQSDE